MMESPDSPHRRAANTFARQARQQYGDVIEQILLFGSVARGQETGIDSDVDLLVILADDFDKREYEDRVREMAYDIELDRGVILSLIVKSASEYEHVSDHPFFRTVRQTARVLYG